MPHGMCYLWRPQLMWMHVVSDILIGLSYLAISVALVYLVFQAWRRFDRGRVNGEPLPYSWVFLAFGAFIVACGATHFMAVWTVWEPVYWLSGGVKAVTAVASVATAVVLPPLVPQVLRTLEEARESRRRRLELEEAHEELKVAHARIKELDEAKTRFFANVSHELRTPLTLIQGPTRKLLEDGAVEAGARRHLETVLESSRILEGHIEDLLDATRLAAREVALEAEELDLARLVRRVAGSFETLARDREIGFEVETPPALSARLDPEKVKRILINLLSNALKFTPEGGLVRVALTGPDPDAPGRVGVLEVRDSGPGIPESMRERVFERFRQVDEGPGRPFGGTGLGLAIVRDLVELHGGSVVAHEAAEGGARLTVELPLGDPFELPSGGPGQVSGPRKNGPPVSIPPIPRRAGTTTVGRAPGVATPAPAPGGEPRRILVVEDNPDLAGFLSEILAEVGEVMVAGDGRQALELARESPPDVVVSDIMMPGMTGEQLLDELRSHSELRDVPFLALTARADDELRLRMLRKGAQDFLLKPFRPEEVQARVANWISVRRTRRVLEAETQERGRELQDLAEALTRRNRELDMALESERMAREQATSALRARTEFLAKVSHELRTPLNAVVGYVDLLRAEVPGPLNQAQQQQLARVEACARQEVALVEDILAFSRFERNGGEVEPAELSLDALVEDLEAVVRTRALEKGLDFRIDRHEAPERMVTDPGRLRQILWNLLSNAVKYTEEGEVTLEIRGLGDGVIFRVRDTGIGIPEEDQDRAFEAFWQGDPAPSTGTEGVGLGLSIARELVNRLQGSLSLESLPGRGTTVEVRIPILEV